MDKHIYEIYDMTPQREHELWDKALFVFDTSSICTLYNLTEETKKTMVDVLGKFQERIWIPAQAMYEYLKNRDKVIMNPIRESYQYPSELTNCRLPEWLNTFLARHKDKEFHPFLDTEAYNALSAKSDQFATLVKEIKQIFKNQYQQRKTEIEAVRDNDIILDVFCSFNIGEPFSMTQIMEIVCEGGLRYKNRIPPGYMDETQKIGTQIYGDLIIWKEVLQYAEAQHKEVILICDDVKEDWYIKHPKGNTPDTPRHELIKEFVDRVGTDFWMYPLRQFINKLEKEFTSKATLPLFTGLEAVKFVLEQREKEARRKIQSTECLVVRCEKCQGEFEIAADDFDFEWESEGSCERGMGPENEYVAHDYISCPQCGQDIEIDFRLWEYPVGAVNYQNIECDGGEIVKEFDFSDRIDLHEESESCVICGARRHVDGDGHCDSCRSEIAEKVKADD